MENNDGLEAAIDDITKTTEDAKRIAEQKNAEIESKHRKKVEKILNKQLNKTLELDESQSHDWELIPVRIGRDVSVSWERFLNLRSPHLVYQYPSDLIAVTTKGDLIIGAQFDRKSKRNKPHFSLLESYPRPEDALPNRPVGTLATNISRAPEFTNMEDLGKALLKRQVRQVPIK